MFTAAVVQSTLLGSGDGVVAGPQPDGIATMPSPETAAAPQDGALHTAGGDPLPAIALQSEETNTAPSPTRPSARWVPATSDTGAEQPVQWPGAPAEWETSLREALAQQAPAPAEPAPTTSAQPPPAAGDADQPDGGVVEDVLGHLGAGP